MTVKIKPVLTRFLFGWAGFISIFFLLSCTSASLKNICEVRYLYSNDIGMWKHIYKNSEPYVVPQAMPSAIILPHHDIAEGRQNSYYKALSNIKKPEIIVLIGPDHYEKGKTNIVSAKNTLFTGPERNVPLAEDLIKKLSNDSVLSEYVSLQDKMWEAEHAMFIHTPYISHYFPDVPIMPIVLKGFSEDEDFIQYKKLAEFLNDNLPENSLVIGSVDFSHYQIPRMTELHDQVTLNTIANFESPRHLEIDSPETVTCIMEYCKLRKASIPVLIDRSSTSDYIPGPNVVSTSHQYWAFYKSEYEKEIKDFNVTVKSTNQKYQIPDYENTLNQTILVGGNGNLNAGIREWWKWDRYKKSEDKAEQLLHDLAGTEARFLTGFDALIFDVKPGTDFLSYKHGTYLYINAVTAANIPSKNESSQKNAIKILVIVENEKEAANQDFIKTLLFENTYNAVVVRSEDCSREAWLYTADSSVYLGTLLSLDSSAINGNIAVLNWQNGIFKIETFDYESQNGIVNKVYQFAPDEL